MSLARGTVPMGAILWVLGLVAWVIALWWLVRTPLMPPLPVDAQRYEDCTLQPFAEGCSVWPD